MHVLIVFAMLLGAPHVQAEVLGTLVECLTVGREIAEMLREHENVKDAQWQCVPVTAGKPA